jgi:hypothetical protein
MWHARIVFLTRLCGKLRELFAIKVRNFKGMETPRPHRFFLLSPASVGGKRAGMLLNPGLLLKSRVVCTAVDQSRWVRRSLL